MPMPTHTQTLENYVKALRNLQEKDNLQGNKSLFDKEGVFDGNKIDLLKKHITLNYMIESTEQVLIFLQQFQKHKTSLATKELNNILQIIDKNLQNKKPADINETISIIEKTIKDNGPNIANKLQEDYQFWSNMYSYLPDLFFFSGMIVPITAFRLMGQTAAIPMIPWAMLIFFATAIILVVAVVISDRYSKMYDQGKMNSLNKNYMVLTSIKDVQLNTSIIFSDNKIFPKNQVFFKGATQNEKTITIDNIDIQQERQSLSF